MNDLPKSDVEGGQALDSNKGGWFQRFASQHRAAIMRRSHLVQSRNRKTHERSLPEKRDERS